MRLGLFPLVCALFHKITSSDFSVEFSYQAPLVSCKCQNISFDWTYRTSTGIPPDSSQWFYKDNTHNTYLIYTLIQNRGIATNSYIGRVMADGRSLLHGTGISLRNVSTNDNGLFYVRLSFNLGTTVVMKTNEKTGTRLTVIDCPKEKPAFIKTGNRTVQCYSRQLPQDLKLQIFKDGEPQTYATSDGEKPALIVDDRSEGNYYCGFVYSSQPYVNVIGAPHNSSIIYLNKVEHGRGDEDDDKMTDKLPFIVFGAFIVGIIICVGIGVVIGVVIMKLKRRKCPSTNEITRERGPDIVEGHNWSGSGQTTNIEMIENIPSSSTPLNMVISRQNSSSNSRLSEIPEDKPVSVTESNAYTKKELVETVKPSKEMIEELPIAEETSAPCRIL